MGSLRVRRDWATSLSLFTFMHWRNGNPLQCSCLENPRDGGAWWVAVYGVAQGWTRVKWLSKQQQHLSNLFLYPGKFLASCQVCLPQQKLRSAIMQLIKSFWQTGYRHNLPLGQWDMHTLDSELKGSVCREQGGCESIYMEAGGVSGSHNALAPSWRCWWWWCKAGHAILGGSTTPLSRVIWVSSWPLGFPCAYPFPKPSHTAFQVIQQVTKYYFQKFLFYWNQTDGFPPILGGPKNVTT